MALCGDSKNQVIFYFVLVSLFFRICHQTEVYDVSSKSQHFVSAINNEQTNAVDKLVRIRQLGASFFSILNFGGESKIEGRTFGRIRMMRKIMLPMAFLGGFLTAVILAIKKISIVNMLLTSSVLMLNLAFMFGKIMVSKALWFHHEKFQNQPNYHYNHWQHSPFDRADDYPYEQQQPISQYSGQSFNQFPPYYINPSQQYPTTYNNQPLAFHSQPALPYNMEYSRLKKQLTSNALQPPNSSLSPAEMDKILTDTLARISSDKSRFPHVRLKRS